MDNKLKLKEMSHKKLRKLCKRLGKEITELNSSLNNLKGEFTTVKHREISWKQQFDAEVYYKNQAIGKSKELSIQLTKLEDGHGDLKQHVRSLEKSLASTARENREKDTRLAIREETIMHQLKRIEELEAWNDKLEQESDEWQQTVENKNKRIADLEHALDALGYESKGEFIESMIELGKTYDPTYIGQMPDELNMGVDGQLKTEEERYAAVEQSEIAETEEHAAWVASEVARVQDKAEGHHVPFDKPTNGVVCNTCNGTGWEQFPGMPCRDCDAYTTPRATEPTKVDKAIANTSGEQSESEAWAKRNGHHFPNGRPEKDRSTSVHIKSADEISADNAARHEEMNP